MFLSMSQADSTAVAGRAWGACARGGVAIVLWLGLSGAISPAADGGPSFSREIRPILADRCFRCHGPDDQNRKAGLRLDVTEEARRELKGGRRAIVPGQPEASELIKRILTDDPDDLMPPAEVKKPLSSEQKELLRSWVKSGARYELHWAFQRPQPPAVPPVRNAAWPRNGIDPFILARLEAEGLEPAPAADRNTLARRAALDLTGLPPSPEDLASFLSDASPEAYEAYIDRLLASPHYGERWARAWLDLARYADTNGYEKDRPRSIWPFRDWVIRALNRDLPFDQFTIEQLAGDLLPSPTVDQLVATGFHRNTMRNEEGGIDPLEFRFQAMNDRVSTTGTAWLGLTLQCAQCHTHKYDPIPQREYYQVMACLNNADEPDLDLPDSQLEATWKRNQEEARKRLAALPEKWPVETVSWQTPVVDSALGRDGRAAARREDGSVLFSDPALDKDTYTLRFTHSATGINQLRLEVLTDGALPHQGPGRAPNGNFVLSEIQILVSPLAGEAKPAERVRIVSGVAEVEQPDFPITAAFDGKESTGWAIHDPSKPLNVNRVATFRFDQPVGFEAGTKYEVILSQQHGSGHLLGRFRIALGQPLPETEAIAARRQRALKDSFEAWLARERAAVVNWQVIHPAKLSSNLPILTAEPDGSVFVSGDITKHDTYELVLPELPGGVTAIRLEVLPDDRLPAHGPGLTYYEGPKGDFFLSEFEVWSGDKPQKLARATHSYAKTGLGADNVGAEKAVDQDLQTGWSCAGRTGERHSAVFHLAAPLSQPGQVRVKMQFWRHYAASLGRFRLAVTTDAHEVTARDLPESVEQLLARRPADLTDADRQELLEHFLLTAKELAADAQEIRRLRRRPEATTTLVMRERPPGFARPTHVHHRGEYLQPKETVEPGTLSVLGALPAEAPRNRLGFARWLVSADNPLTARVVMNRNWALVFGVGLVKTLQDFGFQGEAPSHPELLDWLALEFVRQKWSMKAMHKLMVMSATYRQSSDVSEKARQRDPENRLLSHAPRKRLDAEIVRDAALAASGLLHAVVGGPSIYPPQPASVTSDGTYGAMGWIPSTGPDRYRRGLYVFSKRTAPFAMFNTFDAPSGEACVARRERSNTPLQALTLLNDQVFLEAAQALGAWLVKRGDSDGARVETLFIRSLARRPTVSEREKLLAYVDRQRLRLKTQDLDATSVAGPGEGDVGERAIWTLAARVVFNLDEFITQG